MFVCLFVFLKNMQPMQKDLKMYFYENRKATYSGWPFDEDCACTSENASGLKVALLYMDDAVC